MSGRTSVISGSSWFAATPVACRGDVPEGRPSVGARVAVSAERGEPRLGVDDDVIPIVSFARYQRYQL